MSDFERNIKYLIDRQINWRQDPWSDEPTTTYDWGWYYETGTYQCYSLFASKAKINTFKSLKWHMYVLWYLNPQLDSDDFQMLVKYMCNIRTGFITFKISEQIIQSMIYDVSLQDLERPPPNRLRKVIFKDFSGLNRSEKMSIVGQLVGRSKKIHPDDVYQCMLDINDIGDKITWSKIAELLKCSERTIIRNINNELKKEKLLLNKQL